MNSICVNILINHIAILDSGTIANFIRPDDHATKHIQKQNPIQVQVPNRDIISSNTIKNLTLKILPDKAREAHVFQLYHINLSQL